jgi:hypothetical protein
MPSRHSFLGFAGPVDGARCELTRQGAPLFPASRQKGRPEAGCKKSPAHWGLRGAKWAGPREIATRRCDSATPSFIPPLNNKEEWPGSRSPHRRLLRPWERAPANIGISLQPSSRSIFPAPNRTRARRSSPGQPSSDPLLVATGVTRALSHPARRGSLAAPCRLAKPLNLLNQSLSVRQVVSSKNG